MSALKPQLSPTLDLLAAAIEHPTFPPEELERFKQRRLASITKERAQPLGAARRVLSRLLYGEAHPYAYAGEGQIAEVEAITRDDLISFQQHWLRPDKRDTCCGG